MQFPGVLLGSIGFQAVATPRGFSIGVPRGSTSAPMNSTGSFCFLESPQGVYWVFQGVPGVLRRSQAFTGCQGFRNGPSRSSTSSPQELGMREWFHEMPWGTIGFPRFLPPTTQAVLGGSIGVPLFPKSSTKFQYPSLLLSRGSHEIPRFMWLLNSCALTLAHVATNSVAKY